MSIIKTYITETEAGLVTLAAEWFQARVNELNAQHQAYLGELGVRLKPISTTYKIPEGANVNFDKDEDGTFFVYEALEEPKKTTARPARRRAQKAAKRATKKGK